MGRSNKVQEDFTIPQQCFTEEPWIFERSLPQCLYTKAKTKLKAIK